MEQPHSETNEMRTRDRKRGHPTVQFTYRCPTELMEVAAHEGRDKTEGLTVLLDRAIDAKAALGQDYVEVIVLAHRENITEGEALGRLAKATIEAQRKRR